MRWCMHVAAVGTRLDHIVACFLSSVGVISVQVVRSGLQLVF